MSESSDEKRKRGHPPRGYAEKLLARTQYAMIKSRSGLSDSKLDVEYARNTDGSARSTADRFHVFEHARERGKPLPTDVIKRLSKDPRMVGIRAISESPFWALLEKPPMSRPVAQKLVEKCLKRLNLVRLPLALEERWLSNMWAAKSLDAAKEHLPDEQDVARDILEKLIHDHPGNLDVIALLGALYREACLSFEPQSASYLGTRFWMLMQDFLAQPGFESLDGDLDMFAIYRVIYDRTESDSRSGMTPFDLERLPGSPIGLLLAAEDPEVKELLRSVERTATD